MSFALRQATTEEDLRACVDVRIAVYCDEMGFPYPTGKDAETEGEENAQSAHFLVEESTPEGNLVPVGTIRLFLPTHKLGRLAVLKRCRAHGLGAKLVQAVSDWAVEDAKKKGKETTSVYCHSMSYVTKLYEKAGYKPDGPLFDEQGVPHQKMLLDIKI